MESKPAIMFLPSSDSSVGSHAKRKQRHEAMLTELGQKDMLRDILSAAVPHPADP